MNPDRLTSKMKVVEACAPTKGPRNAPNVPFVTLRAALTSSDWFATGVVNLIVTFSSLPLLAQAVTVWLPSGSCWGRTLGRMLPVVRVVSAYVRGGWGVVRGK